jgi:AraC-like DNA-binding protein
MDGTPNGASLLSDRRAFERVGADILHSFPDLVDELGGDAHALMRQSGIDVAAWLNGQFEVTYRQMIELVGHAAVELDCPDFGMRLAERQASALQTPLVQMVRHSATLGQALHAVIDHSFAHSRAASIWLQHRRVEETVAIGHDILIEGMPDMRQLTEQVLLTAYLTRLDATAGFARARWVEFRHQPVAAPAKYRAHFGCEVRFGQEADAVVYGAGVLDLPIVAPDPTLHRRIVSGIRAAFPDRQPPLHVAVRGIVVHRMASGHCTNASVADELGLHSRTMHRALQREGTSFQRIKDQVRRDLLAHYLDHSDLSLSAISQKLGFAEQSAMTRFCRQCFGAAPRDRRKQGNRAIDPV